MITDEIDWIDYHTEDSYKGPVICYYPTERIAPSLQTRDFEKVETKDLESQTEDTLMYCHSITWSRSRPGGSPASSDERVVKKRLVIVGRFRREDPGVIVIDGKPVGMTTCCWYFYVTNNPAARWLQLANLYSGESYFLRGDDCCLACALKFAPAWADAVFRESTAKVDKATLVLL